MHGARPALGLKRTRLLRNAHKRIHELARIFARRDAPHLAPHARKALCGDVRQSAAHYDERVVVARARTIFQQGNRIGQSSAAL